MKGFNDIIFEPHPVGEGFHGKIFFPNGYGVSVVRFKLPHLVYGSYTSNDDEWEVAILKGDENKWELCYDTEITNDVIGYQTESEVTWIMIKAQQF
jgi:hypothetical protein